MWAHTEACVFRLICTVVIIFDEECHLLSTTTTTRHPRRAECGFNLGALRVSLVLRHTRDHVYFHAVYTWKGLDHVLVPRTDGRTESIDGVRDELSFREHSLA